MNSDQPDPQILKELIALRDGEPHDVKPLSELSQKQCDELLQEIGDIKNELNELPQIAVSEAVWRDKLSAVVVENDKPSGSWLSMPFTAAAAVLLVSTLTIYTVFSPDNDVHSPQTAMPVIADNGVRLAGLMARSRDLEMRLHSQTAGASVVNASGAPQPNEASTQADDPSAEHVLLYRLADVDGQIAQLYEHETMDHAARLQLWEQRVALLENLFVLRMRDLGVRSIYLNDGRSM